MAIVIEDGEEIFHQLCCEIATKLKLSQSRIESDISNLEPTKAGQLKLAQIQYRMLFDPHWNVEECLIAHKNLTKAILT